MRSRLRFLGALLVVAATLAEAGAAGAAQVTWTADRTTAIGIFPNGTLVSPGSLVRYPDGSTRPAPAGWRAVGSRDPDGAVFLERSLQVVGQLPDGHGGFTYVGLLVPKTVVEFAWLVPHETGLRKIAATQGPEWPTPAQGYTDPERIGVIDDGVFVPMRVFQPRPDGLFDAGEYREPWLIRAVSSNGTAFLTGYNGRRGHWAWAMPPAGGGAEIEFVRQPDLDTGASIDILGTARDGRVLLTDWIEGQGSTARILPAGPTFGCGFNLAPLARLADDGGYLAGGCVNGATRTYDLTVTGPGGGQHWRGAPMAVSLLIGGWIGGARRVAGVDRAAIVVGGRERDLTTTADLSQVGVIASIIGNDRQGRLLVRTVSGDRWLLSRRAVIAGQVLGAGGAALADALVTVDVPPSLAPAAPMRRDAVRTVRTDAKGRFSLTTTALRVRLAVAGGWFAAANGCAAQVEIPVGVTPPPPVLGLGGHAAAATPVMAAVIAPAPLRLRASRLALPVRCLLATRCAGTAKVVLGRRTLGSARLGIAPNGTAPVPVRLTPAGARLVTARPRAARFVLAVAGRTVVVPVSVRR